jgi:hypothetical protein
LKLGDGTRFHRLTLGPQIDFQFLAVPPLFQAAAEWPKVAITSAFYRQRMAVLRGYNAASGVNLRFKFRRHRQPDVCLQPIQWLRNR